MDILRNSGENGGILGTGIKRALSNLGEQAGHSPDMQKKIIRKESNTSRTLDNMKELEEEKKKVQALNDW